MPISHEQNYFSGSPFLHSRNNPRNKIFNMQHIPPDTVKKAKSPENKVLHILLNASFHANECQEHENRPFLSTKHHLELPSSERLPTANHELQEVQQVGPDDKAFIDHVQQQNKNLKAVLRDHEATTSKCIALLEGLLRNGDR